MPVHVQNPVFLHNLLTADNPSQQFILPIYFWLLKHLWKVTTALPYQTSPVFTSSPILVIKVERFALRYKNQVWQQELSSSRHCPRCWNGHARDPEGPRPMVSTPSLNFVVLGNSQFFVNEPSSPRIFIEKLMKKYLRFCSYRSARSSQTHATLQKYSLHLYWHLLPGSENWWRRS